MTNNRHIFFSDKIYKKKKTLIEVKFKLTTEILKKTTSMHSKRLFFSGFKWLASTETFFTEFKQNGQNCRIFL